MLVLPFLSMVGMTTAASIGNYIRALQDRDVTVTTGNLDNFKFYVQHAGAAYCNHATAVGSAVTCAGHCAGVESNGATVLATFGGKTTGIAGYVAKDSTRKEIVISVRGSSNVRNWITNLDIGFNDCNLVSDCKTHSGFQDAWDEISSAVKTAVTSAKSANSDYTVVATGHSLGAAVALLAAAYLRADGIAVDLYSYGSPRVGNDAFVNFVTSQTGGEYRVTHLDDPVPRLPPIIFGYRHTSPEYWLSTGTASTTDYSVSQIKVCEGSANINCNAGTLGLDMEAHGKYFQDVSGCSTDSFSWKRLTDAEIEAKVNAWAKQDIEYVANMTPSS